MNAAVERTWWQRNKVAVIVVVTMTLLMCGAVASFFSLFKTSDAYVMGLAAARADPRVAERLGTPIETGFFTTGNINVSGGGSGNANLAIPLHGPKASGTLYVVARRSAGEWKLLRLALDPGDGSRLDLIAPLGAAVTNGN
jgi:hypothetical protein